MRKRLTVLCVGWLLIAVSIVALVRVRLGVAPYDVLNTAVAKQLGWATGTASWLSCAVFVTVAFLLGVRPGVGMVVGAFVVGGLINGGLAVVGDVQVLAIRVVVFALALCVLYTGVCCIILSKTGAGPTELVTVGLMKRGASVRTARWVVEGTCLGLGAALGGSFGVGTVFILAVSGPVLAFLLPRAGRILHLEQ
jgi:uncharacterized membrane protein YczE